MISYPLFLVLMKGWLLVFSHFGMNNLDIWNFINFYFQYMFNRCFVIRNRKFYSFVTFLKRDRIVNVYLLNYRFFIFLGSYFELYLIKGVFDFGILFEVHRLFRFCNKNL